MKSALLLMFYFYFLRWCCIFEGILDADCLMKFKMFISLFIFSWILLWLRTLTFCTNFSLFIFTIFYFCKILIIWIKKFITWYLNPFFILLVISFFWGAYFFLLHEVKVKTSFYYNLDKEIFPVFKKIDEFLLQLLRIFALLLFRWS